MVCDNCKKFSVSLHRQEGSFWVCRLCYTPPASSYVPYFKEMGVENPLDPKGSTAHVRDIKSRRYDPKTEATFRYKPPVRYFF